MIYGKDCPKGKVQIEFVGCSGVPKQSDYSWPPTNSAFIEIYIDGERYRVQVGNYHNGKVERRGLHIIGPLDMKCEKDGNNSCTVWHEEKK